MRLAVYFFLRLKCFKGRKRRTVIDSPFQSETRLHILQIEKLHKYYRKAATIMSKSINRQGAKPGETNIRYHQH